MTTGAVTLLYVPGDRPDRIPKAFTAGADEVIVDLEDAVHDGRKASARDGLGAAAGRASEAVGLQVRVNAPGTTWFDDDLEAVAALPGGVGVRVPKVEDPATVELVRSRVGARDVHLLVETAKGVAALGDIAAARPASIGLGEADLRSELGIEPGPALDWLRVSLVVAVRAAGLPAPHMSAYTVVGDDAALEEDCAAGRRLGFLGRTAVHPRQLAVIRRAFRPSEDELARALAVLEGLDGARDAGSGVLVLTDGRFVDRAMVGGARRTVDLHQRLAQQTAEERVSGD